MELLFTVLCIMSRLMILLAQNNGMYPQLPLNLGRPKETFVNKTMDELITGTMGGVGVASNMLLSDDGSILAELDMILSKKQFLSMYEPPTMDEVTKTTKVVKGKSIRTKRKAIRDTRLRWTNSVIPYLFARGHFDVNEEYLMRRSMTEWERYTCLKFRPATNSDKNSVRFQNGVGCNSQLGMIGGIQVLNLQAPGCRYKGLYLHEIGHAVGLVHEHQLPDRDNYISILYENVDPIMQVWFNKYKAEEVNQMNVPFEYSSVMHYGITAFSKDGKSQTIRAHDKSKEERIGEVYLKELSYTDVQIVNLMYNCSSHCPNKNQCGPDGFLDQNCRCICKDGSSDCDRRKTNVDKTCVNIYNSWACYIWANQGECERNPFYMKQQCAKACGVCGSETNTQAGECKDVYEQTKCQMWKTRGDCVTNENWMKSNCKFTCNLCGDITTREQVNCANIVDNGECDDLVKDGECSVNSKWMFHNCRKSCAMCTDNEIDVVVDNGEVDEDKMECENTHPSCEAWAQGGQCRDNPGWMINNCRKACQKCDDGSCKNLYDDVQCEIWAQKLECLTNGKWMGKHCSKSCRQGVCERVSPAVATTSAATGTRTSTATVTRQGTTTRTTTVTDTAPCKNVHESDTECDIWAKNDHCSINPSWMLKNCAKSCKVCGGTSSGRVTTTKKPSTGTIDSCSDMNAGCAEWAKSDYCYSNPSYSLVFCKESCNNCNGCRDTNILCSVWAKDGHCGTNARYMLRQCQKSCEACTMLDDDRRNDMPTSAMAFSATDPTSGNGASREMKLSLYTHFCFVLFYLILAMML